MKLLKVFYVLLTVSLAVPVFAHEGHDHNAAPGSIRAPHGGVVKKGTNMAMEFVKQGEELKFYPIDFSAKSLGLETVQLVATVKAPKEKDAKSVSTSKGADHFLLKHKASGRFTVTLEATREGTKNNFEFQVDEE